MLVYDFADVTHESENFDGPIARGQGSRKQEACEGHPSPQASGAFVPGCVVFCDGQKEREPEQ
jgi:hypothetical protein